MILRRIIAHFRKQEWAAIHLGLIEQQSAAAAALLESIDGYLGDEGKSRS